MSQPKDEGAEAPEELTQDEATHALRQYWSDRLDEFEKIIYPVFYAKGYSKNTALLAYMMDELDDAVMVAVSAREK